MVISRIGWDCNVCILPRWLFNVFLDMIVEGSKQERFQVSSASEQCHPA